MGLGSLPSPQDPLSVQVPRAKATTAAVPAAAAELLCAFLWTGSAAASLVARSHDRLGSLRSPLCASGALRLLSCCDAAHLGVCNGILWSSQQIVVVIPVALLA